MKVRIISGIIGALLLITVLLIGGIVLDFGILLVSIIGIYEYNNAVSKIDGVRVVPVVNYLLAVGFFALNVFDAYNNIQFVFFLYIITLLCLFVFDGRAKLQDIGITILGGLYVPFLLFHISLLNGSILIWLVFVISTATDTFAYFIGTKFGKTKLAPQLSPTKTIEGSLAGVVGSLIATMVFAYLFDINDIVMLGILGIITSVLAQIGDLTASKIKRIAGIKDYGNIMPGHGGILDRFDSILFTAPIVYYYVHYFL